MQQVLKGVPAAPGIAIGRARIRREAGQRPAESRTADPQVELAALEAAREKSAGQLRDIISRLASMTSQKEAGILRTQLLVLDDPLFMDSVKALILDDGCTAEDAAGRAILALAEKFKVLDDPRLQERAADVRDVGQRVIRNLAGAPDSRQPEAGILFAANLAPSEVSLLEPAQVVAIVTEEGSATGHAAILARALSICAVMGVKDALARVSEGDTVIVDGTAGEVVLNPEESRLDAYRLRHGREGAALESLAAQKELAAITLDGFRVELAANIAGLQGVPAALAAGAESVGVVRTEFLFLGRDTMPSEEEQFEFYGAIVSGMAPRRVIIRTLDVGADKELPYCPLGHERNPALGLRGVRLCLRQEQVFGTQLRAIVRAASFGNVAILLPMISDISEVRRTKEILGRFAAPGVPLGIMVETPAAAIMVPDLAAEVEFFSIGTNDLVQYVLAVDRLDEHLADLYQPFHPAVLRLIRTVSEAAHRHGRWVGVCGEMAANPLAVALFLGLGVDELSMDPRSIPMIRSVIRQTRRSEAVALTEELLALNNAPQIVFRLEQWSPRL
jgi:phosphotransferase system enzyme I (PtsI)